MRELPIPPHFAPARVGEVWRVPYQERAAQAARVGAGARRPAGRRGSAADLPGRRRRAEHLLHPGLRAVRGRALRAPVRSTTIAACASSSTATWRHHAGDPDHGHAPCDADLPPRLAGERGAASIPHPSRWSRPRTSSGACGGSTPRSRQPGAGSRLRAAPAAPLCARDGGGRQVCADRLALPRDAGRHRPRLGLGGRGGDLLPWHRPREPARLPGQGRQPADRALFGDRARGDHRAPRRDDRAAQPWRWWTSCITTTR